METFEIVCLCVCVCVHVFLYVCVRACVCVCVCVKARRDLNVVSNQKRLDYLNNMATGVIFVTTVINFFVSFFGSKRTGFFRWLLARLHF